MRSSLKVENVIRRVLILVFVLYIQDGFAQSILDKAITFSAENVAIDDVILKVSKLSGTEITYSSSFFSDTKSINIDFRDRNLSFILDTILLDSNLAYKVSGNRILIYKKKKTTHTMSGYIIDSLSNERLIGAIIYCPSLGLGTTSNEYGFYSLTLPEGMIDISISYIGYELHNEMTSLKNDTRKTISLTSNNILQEVVVTPFSSENISSFTSSKKSRYTSIDKNLSQYSPQLGGFADPIRSAQLLPGIQSGTDGLEGIYVRGGDSGHNLMMLDGVPVYIPYHLFGLFSVYNQDMVKSTKIYRGSFPASYGGRLSSVFDIRTKEGNQLKWSGNASANLISLNAMIEGPLQKQKSSIILASRVSHTGLLLNPLFRKTYFNNQTNDMESFFYDFNAKANYTFSKNDRIYLSFYRGLDNMKGNLINDDTETFQEQVLLKWSNSILSTRWNHLYNSKLFSNTTLTYSFFDYEYAVLDQFKRQNNENYSYFLDLYSNNNDLGLKIDFDYLPTASHHIKFGTGISLKRFIPKLNFIDDQDNFPDNVSISEFQKNRETKEYNSLEGYVYIEDQVAITPSFDLNIGLRGSSFSSGNKTFVGLEPRFHANYTFNDRLISRISASRMLQYLHLVSHTKVRLPNDIWMPSDERFKPQESWQASLGLDYLVSKNLKFVLDGYTKRMNNLYSFSDDYVLKNDIDFRDYLVKGNGISSGIELGLKYESERTGLRASYTYMQSKRTYEKINQGETFPHAREYPHQIKIFALQTISKGLNIGLNWVYNMGGPAINVIPLNGLQGVNQPPRPTNLNDFLTDYHRLDMNANYTFYSGRLKHTINMGVYNLYNRKNVAYYRISVDPSGNVIYPSVYGIGIRPTFSYKLSF